MNLESGYTDLEDLVVDSGMSVLDVLRVIDRTGLGLALVCEKNRKLLGVMTDGDARRHFIKGGTLDEPIGKLCNRSFVKLVNSGETTRQEAIRLMQNRRITCVPVVDEAGRLIDLHTLRASLKGARCDSWAVIMVGGKGERLGELTSAIPKPMLPIGDRPILEWIVQLLVSHGIRRIFMSVGYLGTMIEDHFGDGSRMQCRIEYLHEKEPLGTGGALSLLPESPTSPLLVMNGDLLTAVNLTRFLAFHRAGEFRLTMALRKHVVKVPFGVAEIDGVRVNRLVEKPALDYHINAGIYAIEPALLKRVPSGRMYPITELIDDCITRKEGVGAYRMQEDWNDIGLPEEYARAHKAMG